MDPPVKPLPYSTEAEFRDYAVANAAYSEWLADNPPVISEPPPVGT